MYLADALRGDALIARELRNATDKKDPRRFVPVSYPWLTCAIAQLAALFRSKPCFITFSFYICYIFLRMGWVPDYNIVLKTLLEEGRPSLPLHKELTPGPEFHSLAKGTRQRVR